MSSPTQEEIIISELISQEIGTQTLISTEPNNNINEPRPFPNEEEEPLFLKYGWEKDERGGWTKMRQVDEEE